MKYLKLFLNLSIVLAQLLIVSPAQATKPSTVEDTLSPDDVGAFGEDAPSSTAPPLVLLPPIFHIPGHDEDAETPETAELREIFSGEIAAFEEVTTCSVVMPHAPASLNNDDLDSDATPPPSMSSPPTTPLSSAATNGDRESQYALGCHLLEIEGDKPLDFLKGIFWLFAAYRDEHNAAEDKLRNVIDNLDTLAGVCDDEKKQALEYLSKEVSHEIVSESKTIQYHNNLGFKPAKIALAKWLLDPKKSPIPNKRKAMRLLSEAVKRGAESYIRPSQLEKRDTACALSELEKLGESSSKYRAERSLRDAAGVLSNEEKDAVTKRKDIGVHVKAHLLGDKDAIYYLENIAQNTLYGYNRGSQDIALGMELTILAANLGSAQSCTNLANIFLNGSYSLGIDKNPKDGLRWLKKAVEELKDDLAMKRLGNLYKKGIPGHLEKDVSKAHALLLAAREASYYEFHIDEGEGHDAFRDDTGDQYNPEAIAWMINQP